MVLLHDTSENYFLTCFDVYSKRNIFPWGWRYIHPSEKIFFVWVPYKTLHAEWIQFSVLHLTVTFLKKTTSSPRPYLSIYLPMGSGPKLQHNLNFVDFSIFYQHLKRNWLEVLVSYWCQWMLIYGDILNSTVNNKFWLQNIPSAPSTQCCRLFKYHKASTNNSYRMYRGYILSEVHKMYRALVSQKVSFKTRYVRDDLSFTMICKKLGLQLCKHAQILETN